MLDNLRFQECEKAIFRARENMQYGNRCVSKGEPLLIVDNAAMSRFIANQRNKNAVGRSIEASTNTIRNLSFDLSNGQIMFNMLSAVYGDTKLAQPTTFTINECVELEDSDTFELPSDPYGEVILYLTDDYGHLNKIAKDQYNIDGRTVTFIKAITRLITYTYEEAVTSEISTYIRQLGARVIASLEMQCIVLDVLTEEKKRVLMKFDKVAMGTNLSIRFNDSDLAGSSTIFVEVVPEDNQNAVNKTLFSIEVI